jgi:hypothetical protein
MLNELDKVRIAKACEQGCRNARRRQAHQLRSFRQWPQERDDLPSLFDPAGDDVKSTSPSSGLSPSRSRPSSSPRRTSRTDEPLDAA